MGYEVIINQILVLFILILFGYILRKMQIIDEGLNQKLSNLLVNFILPALIITSMDIKINQNMVDNVLVFCLILIIIYLGIIILASILTGFLPFDSRKRTAFKFMTIFGNVGYMGLPVYHAVDPEYGLFYGALVLIVFNFLVWSYGIYLFNKERQDYSFQWSNFFNNGIKAILIGFLLILTGISLPVPIFGALELLGSTTFPLSMLIIGASLTEIKLKNVIKDSSLYLLALIKLLLIPLIGWLILNQFNLPQTITTIAVISMAMPAASMGVIFAEKFAGDYRFSAEAVFFTTLLSLFTIPSLVWLIEIFQ